jgi:hypothetical protein
MTKTDKVLGALCLAGLLLAWIASAFIEKPSPAAIPVAEVKAAPTPSISTAEMASNFEECRSKLKAAAQLNVLTDMSFDDGRPRVVVGRTWYGIDYSAKTGLAETAACFFLAGDTTKGIRFEITDNMTGKVVATWSGTRLTVE